VPIHSLIGFQRVWLAPGESKTIEFTISPEMIMLFDDDGKQKLEPGQFRLIVGGCSPDVRGVAMDAPKPVSAVFAVTQ
jgi:beta-glucosidase